MSGAKKKICVVGGGATGVALLWCLTSQATTNDQVELTLLHNDPVLGGHSHTEQVTLGGKTYPIDVGVQYICPLLYPNTYRMLEGPGFENVTLQDNGEIRIAASFGDEGAWGNFADYQTGPTFGLYNQANVDAANDLRAAIITSPVSGRTNETIDEYLKRTSQPKEFVEYFLWPYLSVLNGYGENAQLLAATMEDLLPLFTPIFHPGPLASFTSPGLGWQRFRDGSGAWVNAMAELAKAQGATVLTSTPANAVWTDASGQAWVQYGDTNDPAVAFDEVVLTTDMTTNRMLLDNGNNVHYTPPSGPQQSQYISETAFPLNPGSCYIHQDIDVLSPNVREGKEVLQFTADYAMQQTGDYSYDLSKTYTTWLIQNMVEDLPEPVYVSMYGTDVAENPPKHQLFPPVKWRHGRFLGSYMYTSKAALHNVQGVGNIWFAGNNTTQDSEEGALVSAMVIAGKVCPDWKYPYYGLHWKYAYATFWYELMKDKIMFPETVSGLWGHFRHLIGHSLEGLESLPLSPK